MSTLTPPSPTASSVVQGGTGARGRFEARRAGATNWQMIAQAFERNVRGPNRLGQGLTIYGLCYAGTGCDTTARQIIKAIVDLFKPKHTRAYFWPFDRDGDDCRVIAAGLIAAMYETGEFDVEAAGEHLP